MAKIYFADGVDCRIALQEGASVGDALATAAARLDVILVRLWTPGLRERAGVTLDELRPVARAPLCRAPALFLRATGDALLGAQHTEALARAYGGSRVIADVEGTHSSPRNRRALDYCGAFLREHLHLGAAPPAGRVDRVPWDVTL